MVMGKLLDYIFTKRKERMNILGILFFIFYFLFLFLLFFLFIFIIIFLLYFFIFIFYFYFSNLVVTSGDTGSSAMHR